MFHHTDTVCNTHVAHTQTQGHEHVVMVSGELLDHVTHVYHLYIINHTYVLKICHAFFYMCVYMTLNPNQNQGYEHVVMVSGESLDRFASIETVSNQVNPQP